MTKAALSDWRETVVTETVTTRELRLTGSEIIWLLHNTSAISKVAHDAEVYVDTGRDRIPIDLDSPLIVRSVIKKVDSK